MVSSSGESTRLVRVSELMRRAMYGLTDIRDRCGSVVGISIGFGGLFIGAGERVDDSLRQK